VVIFGGSEAWLWVMLISCVDFFPEASRIVIFFQKNKQKKKTNWQKFGFTMQITSSAKLMEKLKKLAYDVITYDSFLHENGIN